MSGAIRESLLGAGSRGRSHAGLMLNRYSPETVGPGSEESKTALLNAAVKAVADSETVTIYKAALERWTQSLTASSHRLLKFNSIGRLIVGLGGDNVTETGLTLHRTYGVPVLPGSAIKGLAAHYAHQVWGVSDPRWKINGDFHGALFGSAEGDDAAGGLIDFSDGWITDSAKCLVRDVMTPHHGKYYMATDEPGSRVPEPTDFDSPVPVPFLAVKGAFLISLSKRDERLPDAWLEHAVKLVTHSLEEWGIGGKTNADYGRLQRSSETITTPQQTPIAAAESPAAVEVIPAPAEPPPEIFTVKLVRPIGGGTWEVSVINGPRPNLKTGTLSGKLPKNAGRGTDHKVRIVSDTTEGGVQFELLPR